MNFNKLSKSLKKLVPDKVKNKLKSKLILNKEQKLIKKNRRIQKKELQSLKAKKKIKIIFFVIHDSVWKYEELYALLEKNKKFEPLVVIIPLVRDGKPVMELFEQSKLYFQEKKYNFFSSLDSDNRWVDIEKILEPDVIFFTNPHKLTFDKYYIGHFKDKLTCYVPYAFVVISEIWMHYQQDFHQYVWRYFVETPHHKEFSKKYLKLNSKNIRVTGYPGLDKIFDNNYNPVSPWKKVNNSTKKIIWAPHHTIKGYEVNLDYSNFLESADLMFEILEKRKDIQIAFKPHPILKENLSKESVWGAEKTKRYYSKWNEIKSGQLVEGNYIDLFYYSDAMITDSASFIAEYLYIDKPCFFQMKDKDVKLRFNSFGQLIFDYLYKGYTKNDIINFIEETVVLENDYLREERNKFFVKNILPKNKKTATLNIYKELTKNLC